ncbi:MAG TPA: helix-turn-helix transcriptional regulator [Thermoanaerobaculia bacterium]|nr:helix-turn-helix transcriptional regulator [Thermoanaerobaculia bacterium]
MRRGRRDEAAVAVALLRARCGWTQRQLAAAAGVHRTMISDYESGKRRPTRRTLERLAKAAGVSLDWLLVLARAAGDAPNHALGQSMQPAEAIGRAVTRAAQVRTAELAAMLALPDCPAAAPPPAKARARAAELWEDFAGLAPRERQLLLARARDYRSWPLVERLCSESVSAAPADLKTAARLADLALEVARALGEDAASRSRAQGYAWAFIANARRVSGDLHGADRAFSRGLLLWRAGARSALPFDEIRLLDLEASLRRGQRRFAESLALLDQALAQAPRGEAAARLLLNKSATLDQQGDAEGAMAALREAASQAGVGSEPRLLWGIQFNLAACLCHLGRYGDAAALLPVIRVRAAGFKNRHDLARTFWLMGRVAAGHGRRDEAGEAFTGARTIFISEEMPLDVALVNLDLALLLLEEGKTAEIQPLAREAAELCRACGVGREALGALELLARGKEGDDLQALALRIVALLERARSDRKAFFDAS